MQDHPPFVLVESTNARIVPYRRAAHLALCSGFSGLMEPQRHSVIEPAFLITWEPLSFRNAPVSYGAYSYEVIEAH